MYQVVLRKMCYIIADVAMTSQESVVISINQPEGKGLSTTHNVGNDTCEEEIDTFHNFIAFIGSFHGPSGVPH